MPHIGACRPCSRRQWRCSVCNQLATSHSAVGTTALPAHLCLVRSHHQARHLLNNSQQALLQLSPRAEQLQVDNDVLVVVRACAYTTMAEAAAAVYRCIAL
eukprot:GHRQ01039145.1.p1 GENE.GHRQ01039145.1~~GHRQ01039145.1.p1  ORF type:complete len:101 (+),score=21.12 GHRQ01039145.1:363-665(+)